MRRRTLSTLAFGIALSGIACRAEPEGVVVPLRLRALSDTGEPLAGTRFWIDGRAMGSSDSNGELAVQARGRRDARVFLTTACPPAYRTLDEDRPLALAPPPNGRPLALIVRCRPLKRRVALVVAAEGTQGAALPVLVDEEPLGQLDAQGRAHILVQATPGRSLRVALDTSDVAGLLPKNPVQAFPVGDEDAILLFEPSLRHEQKPARVRRPRRPRPPARPYRLH